MSKRFGRRIALREVSLAVPAGRCVALVGPNGAGKSTLLRIAAGLTRPTTGRVLFGGSPVQVPARLRARVGYLAHQSLLYDALTARQNLVFFGRLYGVPAPHARAAELLARFGLDVHGDRSVGAFSRGMQQRLALARALLARPELLLLDEPTAGLDAQGKRLVAELLRELRARAATVVVATHAFEEILTHADEVAVLSAGELRLQVEAAGLSAAELSAISERPA